MTQMPALRQEGKMKISDAYTLIELNNTESILPALKVTEGNRNSFVVQTEEKKFSVRLNEVFFVKKRPLVIVSNSQSIQILDGNFGDDLFPQCSRNLRSWCVESLKSAFKTNRSRYLRVIFSLISLLIFCSAFHETASVAYAPQPEAAADARSDILTQINVLLKSSPTLQVAPKVLVKTEVRANKKVARHPHVLKVAIDEDAGFFLWRSHE